MVENIEQITKNGLSVLQIPQFSKTQLVEHGFSTRIGGVSPYPFGSLNLGLYVDDQQENVQENRIRFANALSIASENVVCGHQTHSTNIEVVTISHRGRGYLQQESALIETDGLITDQPEVALLTCFADCVPIFYLDPIKKVIAVSHCGWKGTVGRLAEKIVRTMANTYGSKSEDILVGIGPSIGPCHYEVDRKLLNLVEREFTFASQCIRKIDDRHGMLDLWKLNQLQLIAQGIINENISVSQLCTYCHPEIFFSHRATGGQTGRMGGLLMLKENV